MKLVLFAVLLGACTEPAVELKQSSQAIIPEPIYDEDPQGRYLLGSVPDGLTAEGEEHFSVQTTATNRVNQYVAVVGGALVVNNSAGTRLFGGVNPRFRFLEMQSASGATLRIDDSWMDSWPQHSGPPVTNPVYHLSYRAPGTNNWVDYCESSNVAVPSQGTWSGTGFHTDGTNVSFACRDGTDFKCFTWKYIPGAAGSVGWNANQACTRMARADYCGNGHSHTRELTPIVIRDYLTDYNPDPSDLRKIKSFPVPPENHYFEAAWLAGDGVGAKCLSKHRWAALPLVGGAGCDPGVLDDPRTVPGAKFCEEYMDDGLIRAGALVVNASKTYDMFLHRWMNDTTGDVVATVRGFHSDQAGETKFPFTGYEHWLGEDGIVLRNLPGSIAEDTVTEVYVTGTTDLYVAPNSNLTRTNANFEGYTLDDNISVDDDVRVPFSFYSKTGDGVSSMGFEDKTFTEQYPMGFVLVPYYY